jgi:uncharacterized membrane protein
MPKLTIRTRNEQLYYSAAIATGVGCLVLLSSRGVGRTILPIVFPICTIVSSKLIFLLVFKTLQEDDGWFFTMLDEA